MTDTTAIPEVEGLFTWPSARPQLIAGRCPACGATFFPVFAETHRPGCRGEAIEQVLLGPEATVASWTVQRYTPPPPFPAADPYQPMVIVTAAFDEGLQVPGQLVGLSPDEVRVGLRVRTVAGVLYRSADGIEHLTWKFAPLDAAPRDEEETR